MNLSTLTPQIDTFMQFLNASKTKNAKSKIKSFFMDISTSGEKEVVFDQGNLMFVLDGKQLSSTTLNADNARVVKLDKNGVVEINPFAYLSNQSIEMKSDDSNSKRRSGRSGRSGTSSNNNNNNNNG